MATPRFVDKVVVVTGAARGIGDAIVQAFLEEGARVFVLDLLSPQEPRSGVQYLESDIADPGSVWSAFERIAQQEGRVDVLVNNAGIQRVGLVGALAAEDWTKVIGTNLTGAFLCNSAAVPLMPRHSGSSIVHIASTAAQVGLPGRGPYSAAKAGLLALTRVMAVELASVGIRVNAVGPGFTRTGLVDQAIRDGSLNEPWMLERVPMGRLADPSEIAKVVRFLASDEASYITGQVIFADGGWTAQGIGAAPEWLSATPQESSQEADPERDESP
jgi:NAD(P)-dependent dehydrogenase (short-subunit alcohol dehydrogenase family)